MRNSDGSMEDDKHHACEHKGRRHDHHGAKTFRRGRALDFLNRLTVRRDLLKQQLDAPEFQEIKLILQGELKALDLVIEEYSQHFELHEYAKPQEPEQEEGKS
ncbi:hypothetical protein CIG75_00660 [Tumebacillus algifaecis]|uniref:2-keto-3-deoxygluconate kinase n=1 Tax=Tumebacillus algifaecis TaxID=1214604 RepID=A0A223CWX6_9BACL|nr:hypothetical protein [Tumebacillus algifaecis]ASS73633.1 hypothetical protein CIG75_00660 [Tumebacillus algifaecis]